MGAWSDLDAFKRRVIQNSTAISEAEALELGREAAASPATPEGGNVSLRISPDLAARARQFFTPNEIVTMGWLVLLTRRVHDGWITYQMSASARPQGRVASDRDRDNLYKIAKRLGAPDDGKTVLSVSPSGVYHWLWKEPDLAA